MSLRAGSVRVFLLLIGLLLGVGIYSLIESPLFRVEKVTVLGTSRLPARDVKEAARIAPGTHFLKIRPREVQANLSVLPWVLSADVRVRIPGELVITITERRPVGYIPVQGGFYSFDSYGVLLEAVTDPKRVDLPVLTGLDLSDWGGRLPEPGYRTADERIVAAGDLLRALGTLGTRVSEVSVNKNGEFIIYTLDGKKALFGDVGPDLGEKVELLREILQDIENDGVRVVYIDLRFKGRPTIKIEGS